MSTKICFSSFFIVLAFISCNTTEPDDNGNSNTIDSTSQNFTWQKFEFGQHSSSVLYDIAVIDENNIWAVGAIYMNDSLGHSDSKPYAVAHWNGIEWQLLKVPYHDFNQTVKYPGPLYSVAIIEEEVYVVSYANLLKWSGNDWVEKAFFMEQIPFNGQVSKMWGTNKDNIFCVGKNGAIYSYLGSNWQKTESGTDLDIYDINGKKNSTSGYEIYAVAAKKNVNADKKIFKIYNNSVVSLPASGIPYSIRSIWFKPGEKYYIVGSGMYEKDDINSNKAWKPIHIGVTEYYLYSIEGQDVNDIAACGAFGELLHFNGINWKSFQQEIPIQAGAYYEVKIKDDLVVAVGYDSPKAVIAIGRR